MRNSMTTAQRGAVQAGDNWRIENNEISYNAETGVVVNKGSVLNGNFLHHNGRYGFAGGPSTNIMISNNEVSWNNTARNSVYDAGGSKIVKSSYVTFRGNYVHDNYGHGLHTDTDNIHITYENNTVNNNEAGGIFHENSYDAVIRNNKLSGNDKGIAGQSLYWGADLYLNDSQNTEIYGNTINAGVHGIGLHDIDRGSGPYGTYQIANVNVHDNTVTLPTGGLTGLVGSRTTAYASTTANRFVHNSYLVTSTAAASWLWSSEKTWSQWRSLGNDTTGTLSIGT
jgi:parallel beta-helix repeat protein